MHPFNHCRFLTCLGYLRSSNNIKFVSDVHGRILVVPVSLTIVEGSQAILQCRSDGSVTMIWRYRESTESGGNSVEYLYNGFKIHKDFQEIYRVENTTQGQCDLVISSTHRSHAGTYTCAESESTTSFSSELVVLSKHGTYLYLVSFI